LSTILPLLMLAACGGPAAEPDDAVTAKLPPAATSPQATALGPFPSPGLAPSPAGNNAAQEAAQETPPAEPGAAESLTVASSRYTSLDAASCTPLDDGASDIAAERRRCPGPTNYALETSDSGRQQDLAIIAPGGRRAELNLAKLAANARLGKTAEWRRDASGRPRALIVRVDAAQNPGAGAKVSNLVVTRLNPPSCIVAVIPQGPRQNEKARAAADGERLECMEE
jgi:hypothetical protein